MPDKMKTIGKLISISYLSGLITIGVTGLICTIVAWRYASNNAYLNKLVYGPDTTYSQIDFSNQSFENLKDLILGNHVLGNIVYFMIWMLIGVGVLLVVLAIIEEFSTFYNEIRSFEFVHSNKLALIKDLIFKLLVRSAVVIGAAFYTYFIIKFLLPYASAVLELGVINFPALSSFALIVLAFLMICLQIHVYTVLLRVHYLRTRVFEQM